MSSRNTLFLSSTKADLAPFRDVAIHVAERLGMGVIAMEDFGPDSRNALAVCREKVRSADLFLGLYAYRYGFQPEGDEGPSITELEYDWALAAGIPTLLFLVDEEQPWPPKHIDDGSARKKLQLFKDRLRSKHVVAPLTTPEQLREDLFVHLPKFQAEQPARERPSFQAIPSTPEPYVAHTYTLLETRQVVGRQRELAMLDSWVGDPGSRLHSARILCLVAIGGMGKSALTWKWFHSNAPQAMKPLAGRLWWSFYEPEADFGRFVTSALAYCTGHSPQELAQTSSLDRETELLSLLDRQPFLLVLDGLERLLIAYAGLDFAHLADDDLDTRTANAVAGALGLPEVAGDALVGQHRLRNTIDPRIGNFLRKLAKVQTSRVLVTTRLYPSELQTVTGHELPGSAAVFLRGLEPEDALLLWREMGVSGDSEELAKLFATFDRYPLLIRALAGEVARFRRSPGNFDAWRRAHPDFDPFTLPLVQVKSHVLAFALGNLDENAKEVLRTIAAFRTPTEYDILFDLFASSKGKIWSIEVLDNVLTELEDRGLLGWNRQNNQYDLHPIVRSVVWGGLDQTKRYGVYDGLRSYFEAIPRPESRPKTLQDTKLAIELFNVLAGLGRFKAASEVYFSRLLFHDFAYEGGNHTKVAMLESLFPNGLDKPPDSDKVGTLLSHLGHSYRMLGRLNEALDCYLRTIRIDPNENLTGIRFSFISENELLLGRLREALYHEKKSLRHSDVDSGKFREGNLAVYEATTGRIDDALRILSDKNAKDYYDPRVYLARIDLLRGNYWQTSKNIMLYASHLRKIGLNEGHSEKLVLAEAQMNLGQTEEARHILLAILQEATAKSIVLYELQARRVLADLYRRQGELNQAREMLEDLWEMAKRGPYRLILADAYIVLAKIEQDAGHLDEARLAAQEAYRQAYCDGPPYTYYWALKKATALIEDLGVEIPQM